MSSEKRQKTSHNFVSPSSAKLRLMNDLKLLEADCSDGISASPQDDDNLFVWNATIIGPDESPHEGAIYNLKLIFGPKYPETPPRVRFMSDMFHPNVYADGTLCLDIIQDAWSPIYTVSTILTSIRSLLTDPNPASPANPDAAKMYLENFKEYKRRVRKYAQRTTGC